MKGRGLIVALLCLAGCDQKMAEMPKRLPFDMSPLFADGAADRLPVAGTVATDETLSAQPNALPAALPLAMLEHGRDRFNVFCSPCHAYDGHGDGRVVRRGFPSPPDLHSATITSLSDSQIFDVITHGYGVMFPYGSRVPADDRWAIIAYVRALQYADRVPVADLTPELRARLEAAK
ncbi:MAG TPA: cytochrome c [Hyphomicrobiaceae bacterium]|nr:cytochrome c [Hyphomicrobiaceae bacterium]